MAEAAVVQVARIGTVVRPRRAVSVIEQDPADDRSWKRQPKARPT